MKISVKHTLQTALIAVALAMGACSQTDSNREQQQTDEASAESVNIKFEDPKLDAVFARYIELKNSLVGSDAAEAQSAAEELQKALSAAGYAETAQLAQKIASSGDLPGQRASLDPLTLEIEKLIKSTSLNEGTVYKQYCPMANGGEGGSWFSSAKEIRNPYYGDEMLECGTVKEELN